MDCTSESASHYAGCECNEEHWREQLATAVAAREEAEERAAFLLELLRATVRTGTKDPLLDARLAEEIRSHE